MNVPEKLYYVVSFFAPVETKALSKRQVFAAPETICSATLLLTTAQTIGNVKIVTTVPNFRRHIVADSFIYDIQKKVLLNVSSTMREQLNHVLQEALNNA